MKTKANLCSLVNAGKKSTVLLILTLCLMLTTSCELKRNNPLDPEGNSHIQKPPQIIGLSAIPSPPNSATKYVQMTWNSTNATGYFIYMSLAYNSAYLKVGYTGYVNPNENPTASFTKAGMTPGDYFFKVSACQYYGSGPIPLDPLKDNADFLEGHLSEYKFVRIPN